MNQNSYMGPMAELVDDSGQRTGKFVPSRIPGQDVVSCDGTVYIATPCGALVRRDPKPDYRERRAARRARTMNFIFGAGGPGPYAGSRHAKRCARAYFAAGGDREHFFVRNLEVEKKGQKWKRASGDIYHAEII